MMKRSVIIGLLAVAAMTAVSCNKEIETVEPVLPSSGKHVVSFSASGVETRTSIQLDGDVYSALWSEEDAANFTFYENGQEGTLVENGMTISSDHKTATFKVEFPDGETAPFCYNAIMGAAYSDGVANLLSVQSPAVNNIDGNADILVSKELQRQTQPSPSDEMHFQFKRVVSINKMTLRGLEVGERVTQVVISGDKHLAAAYDYVNDAFLTNGVDDNTITLNYTANNVIGNAGTFDIFFVCAPAEDALLTVTVTTADNATPANTRTYSKELARPISFDLETVAEFVVNMTCSEAVGQEAFEVFKETFNSYNSKGGNSDGFATAGTSEISSPDALCDREGWSFTKGYPAAQSVKFGGSSSKGQATTPALGITQSTATITIKAAAWSNETAALSLAIADGCNGTISNVSPSSSLSNGAWGTYTATITNGDANTKVVISANKNRFFLDEVVVTEMHVSDPNEVSLTVADNTDIAAGMTEATVAIASNKAWTVTSTDPLLGASPENPIRITGTALDQSFTVNFAEANTSTETDKVATLTVTAGAGTYAVSKTITVTQQRAEPLLKTYTYPFTFRDWTSNESVSFGVAPGVSWSGTKDGNQFTSGQGVQVTTGVSGVSVTSSLEFVNVSKIVITYCTNNSKGVGTIQVKVGSGTAQSFSVTKPSSGGTTLKTHEYNFSGSETGAVNFTVNCTENSIYINKIEITAESVQSGSSGGHSTVTTGQVTNLAPTTATFNGSFSGATGTISDHGFWYKKSSDSQWQIAHLNGTTTQGNFTANVSGLSENTTYIVKAWVEERDEESGQFVDRFGDEITFTTPSSSSISTAYLNDYGMPDVSSIVTGLGTTGRNDRDDHWYRYYTNSSTRQIAIHTYTHPTSSEETVNYVVLYDGSNYAPVWTAHTMNQSLWPDNGVGRYDDWTNDPAISLTQQSGLDNAGTVGYSKGHLVASEYRQTTAKQNKQTFYYSNQAPQWQNGFNSGVWNALENRVRATIPTESTMMYVVTGVLYEYDGSPTTLKSGSLNVPIPTHFYKCIMQCTFNGTTVTGAKGIAFVYTNQSHSSATSYYGADGSESFVTSIDAIEQRAGFDFFAKVPDNLEAAAEANTNHTWFTGKS